MEIKDLAGISEPLTRFIELVSRFLQPTFTIRDANASAEALLIQTNAEVESASIRQRALSRLAAQETKRQQNCEATVRRAAKLVSKAPPKGKEIQPDWLTRFLLEVQDVSDARFQEIWARLLAGEFESPGTFSRRVFSVIKNLEPKEAELIDSLADKLLWVADAEGAVTPFLNSHIFEEWRALVEPERNLLGATPIPLADVSLLKEIGVVDAEDFSFRFSVEGPVRPDKIHISSGSVSRIFSRSAELVPEHVQPAFVRTQGPTVTPEGSPTFNSWTKEIEFDAWKLTNLGASLLKLCQKGTDYKHLQEIGQILMAGGMKFTISPVEGAGQ